MVSQSIKLVVVSTYYVVIHCHFTPIGNNADIQLWKVQVFADKGDTVTLGCPFCDPTFRSRNLFGWWKLNQRRVVNNHRNIFVSICIDN